MKNLIPIFLILHLVSANSNNFENVICGDLIFEQFEGIQIDDQDDLEHLCIFNEINSKFEFDQIFSRIQSGYQFYYDECTYIHYSHNCERKRNPWNTYSSILFHNSHLENLAVDDHSLLSSVKSLTALNVGLTQLNRDDLQPYKALEKINLSINKITFLPNMAFRHLEFLVSLNLSLNEIQSIHIGSFDECSQTLQMIDLSYNKLKAFPANILDALTVKNINLHLQHNEIELMAVPIMNKDVNLNTLDISNNKLKSFRFNCTEIETLWVNNNQLEEYSTPGCVVHNLYLYSNQLEELKVEKVSSLFLSHNIRLKHLTISDVSELIVLEASDFNPNVITMAMLKNATELKDLDLTGTFIGPIGFDTFADMTQLEELRLRNTGISRIDYGMLSHQKHLTYLDVSYNNFGSIDLHVMTNLKKLQTLDISGNNLTHIPNVESIKKIFPKLEVLGIDQNEFNCTYLAMVLKILNENNILLIEPENPVKTSSNIFGIGCENLSTPKVKPLENDGDAIARKLNEVIQQMNDERAKFDSEKYDNDVVKSELFHIRNEMLDIKTKMIKNQLSTSTSANGSVDMNEVKRVIETVNNFTLEKQKLAQDQILQKFNELHLEVARVKLENEKLSRNQNFAKNTARSSDDDIRGSTSEILLTIVITSLVIAAVVFIYTKCKEFFSQHVDRNLSVRARSTNTINTTVEMPLDDRHY